MPITGHANYRQPEYAPISAHEEQVYEIQNLIMEAEVRGDEVALQGLRKCYVFVVMRGAV